LSLLAALLLAAVAAAESPICTDRPAKANAVCTVPAGRFQVESSLLDWNRIRSGGSTTETLSLGSSFLKYGLSDHSDLQVGLTPYLRVRLKEGDETDSTSGIGDVIVRLKQRLTREQAPVQVALIPFVKLPTAKRGIGNRKAEGGLAVPISFRLVGPVSATLGPELDLNADADGHGHHVGLVNLISLSATISPKLTLVGELWSNRNFDPAGTTKQASADAALAYACSETMQLDVGVNAGLTADTPDVELYSGLSLRF
jgi:hypothetical protein